MARLERADPVLHAGDLIEPSLLDELSLRGGGVGVVVKVDISLGSA